jgi:hypothetical protein
LERQSRKSDGAPTQAWRAEYEEAHARDTETAYNSGYADAYATGRADVKIKIEMADVLLSNAARELEKGRTELSVLRHGLDNKPAARPRGPRPAVRLPTSTPPRRGNGAGSAEVGKSGLRRMMIALAQRPGLNRRQLGVRAGLSSRSGSFDTYLSRIRSSGWATGGADGMRLTLEGISALGHYEPLPEGRELLDYWLAQFGNSGAARILKVLSERYPKSMTRAELGEAAVLSDRSGSFDTYLSRLRTLELVVGRGELTASEELFS